MTIPAAKVEEVLSKLWGELSWEADCPSYELLDKESTFSAWRELLADLAALSAPSEAQGKPEGGEGE